MARKRRPRVVKIEDVIAMEFPPTCPGSGHVFMLAAHPRMIRQFPKHRLEIFPHVLSNVETSALLGDPGENVGEFGFGEW